jgi:septal ring factor EnvC (AmiA/AmiB activator)
MKIRPRSPASLLMSMLPLLFFCAGASAIEVEEPVAVGTIPGEEASLEEGRRAREAELEAIRRSIEVSERRQAALGDEIDGLEADHAELTAELIATAQRMRAAEEEIAHIEARLSQLHANEDEVRASLRERHSVMSEVLMALQRMGRTPPPAILSRPEDALAAIRGSILAGAVLPDIRGEAEALADDLGVLTALSARIQSERDLLRASYTALGEEQARIDLLVASKQAQREQTAAALAAERDGASKLAGEAESLQSLIESMEKEMAAAAEAAALVAAEAQNSAAAEPEDAATRLVDTSRIAPAMRFADAKGRLTWPVVGEKVLGFGDPDGFGGESQGLSLATRPGAPVLAPTDGWVVYAGPFRSYGQVLILNAGDDYHIVMAGMERIDVALRQFVLAGEPVAAMGATRLASLDNVEHTSAQPILYVEFRRNGTAIDSEPWWAEATDGEVNG